MFPTFIVAAIGAGSPEVITLSGETLIDDTASNPTDARCGVRINNDGTIDKYLLNGGGYTQIDSASDWLIPNRTALTGEYSVRCTNNGATLTGGSSATGSWLDLDTTREWLVEELGIGTTSLNLTLEISSDGGSTTLDSGIYSGDATVDP